MLNIYSNSTNVIINLCSQNAKTAFLFSHYGYLLTVWPKLFRMSLFF